MTRSRRLAALAGGLALLLITGGAIVAGGPLRATDGRPATAQSSPEAEETLKPEHVKRVVERLKAAGIDTSDAAFADLAGRYGVGGAVRLLAFADASGKTPAQIAAMFDAGKGWGQIRRELELVIGPGIGRIMGGGHGKHEVPAESGGG